MTKAAHRAEASERTCVVTRQVLDPAQMFRFVLAPDGTVTPDLKHKLPGRGVWVTATAEKVAEAVRKQAFTRGFKAKVQASESLADDLDALLVRDALQFLALVNKSGAVVVGSAKVETAITKGPLSGLLHAKDGGADGVRKLDQVVFRTYGDDGDRLPRVRLFETGQLDLALGRTNVIHAALKRSAASDAFLERCRRLASYRGSPPSEGVQERLDILEDTAPTSDDGLETENLTNGHGPGIRNE